MGYENENIYLTIVSIENKLLSLKHNFNINLKQNKHIMMNLKNLSALALLAGLLTSTCAQAQWTRVGSKTFLTNVGDSVGIGTTTPAFKVDIRSTGVASMSIKSTASNANILLDRKGSTGTSSLSYRTNGINNWQTGTVGNNHYVLKNVNLNKVALHCDYVTNRIGIGNTAPGFALSVNGGTGTADTVAAADVVVLRTGNFGIAAIRGTSQPAPGFGIGVQGNGNDIGVLGNGGNWGLLGIGNAVGTWSQSNGFVDTTSATGNGADGSDNIAGPANFGIGAYTESALSQFNYGIFSVCGPTGTPSDSDDTHHNWAGYFLGDIVASRTFRFSDNKLKSNIQPIENALEKLNKLQTSVYTFNQTEFPDLSLPAGKQLGFVAENMQSVFPELVRNATSPKIAGIRGKTARNSVAFKAVNYEGIIPVLVAAVKEQKQIVDVKTEALSAKIAQLEKENAELKSRLDAIEKLLSQSGVHFAPASEKQAAGKPDAASLEQNNPNPFSEQSVIKYYIPAAFRTAQLVITDMNGEQLKSITINNSGFGQVTINKNELQVGSYLYSLVVDGAKADTRMMVLTK